MLKNPALFANDPTMAAILGVIGQGKADMMLEEGIWECGHFSLGNKIYPKLSYEQQWPDLTGYTKDGYLSCTGVADSLDQIKEKYKELINDTERFYCLSITEIKKSEQPDSGGWRWHKWGEYIGTKTPQCEYLYDEDDSIQSVFVFHFYLLN
jgi:hypothetical protein